MNWLLLFYKIFTINMFIGITFLFVILKEILFFFVFFQFVLSQLGVFSLFLF